MNSLNTTIKLVRDALNTVDITVYHYWRPASEDRYVIWAEDSEPTASLHGDNRKAEQTIHGTIDLFTKTEYDQAVDDIQTALNTMPSAAWRLSSVQYEDDTGYIHYEWEFEVS